MTTDKALSRVRPSVDVEVRIHEAPAAAPEKLAPATAAAPAYYEEFARLVQGRGTVCLTVASSADVPPPDTLRDVWDQVVKDSTQRVSKQVADQATRSQRDQKTKKLEAVLEAALNSGNIDLAMLAISGLETRQVNEVAAGLMRRMHGLQQQRRGLSQQISQLGNTPEDQKKIQDLNLQIGDIGTEVSLLQNFLQDVMAQKSEAQQMASNYLKSRHETAMAIIRNGG